MKVIYREFDLEDDIDTQQWLVSSNSSHDVSLGTIDIITTNFKATALF